MPPPRIGHDRIEIGAARRPPQLGANARGGGIHHGRIAGAAFLPGVAGMSKAIGASASTIVPIRVTMSFSTE